jgi:hypothetical protein
VTKQEYDVVERYRDLGGNLMFLSANNFFWQVERRGRTLRKIRMGRDLDGPEAALVGVQYLANDQGKRKGVYVVRSEATAPWVWERTGLLNGATFGHTHLGFGIEIDTTTRRSPRGTIVLAEVPEIYGPGYTAQMTYYETAARSEGVRGRDARLRRPRALQAGEAHPFEPLGQVGPTVGELHRASRALRPGPGGRRPPGRRGPEPAFAEIDWRRPAEEVHRQVRAWWVAAVRESPRGALGELDGERVRVLRTRLDDREGGRRVECRDGPI